MQAAADADGAPAAGAPAAGAGPKLSKYNVARLQALKPARLQGWRVEVARLQGWMEATLQSCKFHDITLQRSGCVGMLYFELITHKCVEKNGSGRDVTFL